MADLRSKPEANDRWEHPFAVRRSPFAVRRAALLADSSESRGDPPTPNAKR